jgi:hypothetical protein
VSEGRKIAAAELKRLHALSRDELLRFEDEPQESTVEGPSGRPYRVRVSRWEDPDDGDGGAEVRVHGTGWRHLTRLRGRVYEPPPEIPEAQRSALNEPGEITNRTRDLLDGVLTFALFTALIAPWFIGVGFLISLLF